MAVARVVIKERKARPFWFGHPWVFSGAIERVKGRAEDGEVVEVVDHEGRLIGHGFWNGRSQIQVRIVALAAESADLPELIRRRLDRALALRRDVLRLPARTNAYRLVHAEGDGLPGLVVDALGAWLVVQVSCLGMLPHLDLVLDHIEGALAPAGILERPAQAAAEEGIDRPGGLLRGRAPEGPVQVVEDGAVYFCDPDAGQKTGFFSDQRENRRAAAPLAAGREVLDAFSYVGGFGLRMAREGAAAVHLVDSSEPALESARAGAEANGVAGKVTFEKGNVLRVLDHMHRAGRSFDLVVLDPPKLVHRRAALDRGLRLYGEINLKAVRVVRDGGILVTCSCSQHVLDAYFDELLGTVAKESGVRLQEVQRGGQAPDHPVLLPHEESRYLKCRVLRVWK